MIKDEQTIANLKRLKSFHNGSYGADIDRAIEVLAFRKKAEIVISQLRADRDRLQGAFDKIGVEILKASVEDYKYHGCGTGELIIETSEVLEIIDKYSKGGEENNG